METNSTFYTDSNGREMLERIRYYRPTYNVSFEEPIAMNYHPIPTRIFMKDDTKQISVVTDRSEGGGSLDDGQLELMVKYGRFFVICWKNTNNSVISCWSCNNLNINVEILFKNTLFNNGSTISIVIVNRLVYSLFYF